MSKRLHLGMERRITLRLRRRVHIPAQPGHCAERAEPGPGGRKQHVGCVLRVADHGVGR